MTRVILKRFFQMVSILAVCYGFISGYHWWLDSAKTFMIHQVQISGNEYFSEQELLRMASIDNKESIWNVTLEDAAAKIKRHPFVEDVHISREFPDILKINIQEKKPVALLNFENQLYCLDPEGMVLPSNPGKSYHLPVISGQFKGGLKEGSQIQNQWVQDGLVLVQHVLKEHPQLYGRISELVVGKTESSILILRDGGIPVYLKKNQSGVHIEALYAVLSNLSKEGTLKEVNYIDLTYQNQVVVGMGA